MPQRLHTDFPEVFVGEVPENFEINIVVSEVGAVSL
jgi:hypothetical protein